MDGCFNHSWCTTKKFSHCWNIAKKFNGLIYYPLPMIDEIHSTMLTVSVIIFSFRQVLSSRNEFFVIGEKIKPRCSEDKFDSLWKISRCLQWKLEEESDCITAKAYSILSRYACESLCEKTVDKFEKADRIQQDIGDNSSIVRALCLGKLGRCYGQRKQLNRAAPFIRKSIEICEMKPHNKMQMWPGYDFRSPTVAYNSFTFMSDQDRVSP